MHATMLRHWQFLSMQLTQFGIGGQTRPEIED
jgi:hypothetical protein